MEKNARQFTLDEQHEIRKFISQGILQGRGSVCVRTGESGAVKVSRSVLALTDSRPRISTLLPPLRSPSVSLFPRSPPSALSSLKPGCTRWVHFSAFLFSFPSSRFSRSFLLFVEYTYESSYFSLLFPFFLFLQYT